MIGISLKITPFGVAGGLMAILNLCVHEMVLTLLFKSTCLLFDMQSSGLFRSSLVVEHK